MRPSEVALNLGTPPGSPTRTSSEFEEVNYPSSHWSSQQQEEELPLHYMTEETARRRIKAGAAASNVTDGNFGGPGYGYDDEGKDVYNKMKPVKGPTLGGRPQRPAPPPATNLVSGCLVASWQCTYRYITKDGIHPTKLGASPASYIYLVVMLDSLLPYWPFQYCCLGWGSLWEVRLTLSKTRLLLRCSSSAWEDAGWTSWTTFRLWRSVRLQKRDWVSWRRALCCNARLACNFRCCTRTLGVVYFRWTRIK